MALIVDPNIVDEKESTNTLQNYTRILDCFDFSKLEETGKHQERNLVSDQGLITRGNPHGRMLCQGSESSKIIGQQMK